MADAALHIGGKTRSASYIALPITEVVLNIRETVEPIISSTGACSVFVLKQNHLKVIGKGKG